MPWCVRKSQCATKRGTQRIVISLGVFGMLFNHDPFIPATISSKGSPTWRIMSLAFIRLILKPLISTYLPNPGAVTLIDVTLTAHNRQHSGSEYSVGAAAILRAREKHDMYNRTFDFSSDAVRLEVFAIEMLGALHREGRQFLRTHATATDPGLQFSNILKTLSVAVQTARAKCVNIARDRLILDTAPLVPFINGLLPVPPPVSLTLPIVHVRYDALTSPTAYLPPAPRFPPLPPTPSPSPLPLGHLPCPSGNAISAFSYVKLF